MRCYERSRHGFLTRGTPTGGRCNQQYVEKVTTVRAFVRLAKETVNCIKFKGFREYAR